MELRRQVRRTLTRLSWDASWSSTISAAGSSSSVMDLLPPDFPNAALIMRYLSGTDSSGKLTNLTLSLMGSLGRHSDDEADLGFERCIVSLSLAPENTSRLLKFYHRKGLSQ